MTPTESSLIEGIKMSLANAKVLYDDAEFLRANSKYARAYFLYQISIEEIGKAQILFTALLNEDHKSEDSLKVLFKKIRDHKIKTTESINTDFVLLQIVKEKELALALINDMKSQYDNITGMNNYKNNSLYVNYDGGTFYKPENYISIDLVERLEQIASLRLMICKDAFPVFFDQLDSLRSIYQKKAKEFTPEELEEWAKKFIIDNWKE